MCVGIYKGIRIPGFPRWCRTSFIHSIGFYLLLKQTNQDFFARLGPKMLTTLAGRREEL